ncbi:hypothetical protein, partial [Klebsiella pneumoniae]|uniref:hypothetical protein n=1 Tax=Klebsiella pneumoniae TaxID=573 RepID=UPI001C3D8667
GHGACVEQDDKGWDARKRAYCLKIQPATGSFARNLIYSTKPHGVLPLSEMVVAGLYLKTSTPYYLKNHLYLLKGCYE